LDTYGNFFVVCGRAIPVSFFVIIGGLEMNLSFNGADAGKGCFGDGENCLFTASGVFVVTTEPAVDAGDI
jgi:hypothetical protein